MLVTENLLSRVRVAEAMVPKLTEFETKQLDIFVETNRQLTTLASALIAAAAGFLLNRDSKVRLAKADMRRAAAIWISAALSLYFGHLAYRQIVWMLSVGFFDLFYAGVWWPARLQFLCFLISAVLLADFVFRTVQQRQTQASGETA
jgi:hypothetical protein